MPVFTTSERRNMVSIQFEHDLKESVRTIPDYPKPGIMNENSIGSVTPVRNEVGGMKIAEKLSGSSRGIAANMLVCDYVLALAGDLVRKFNTSGIEPEFVER